MTSSAGDGSAWLTIGELAERTGMRPTTLRMWETRYGFPRPERLDSGHRRYSASEADQILRALQLRESGVRLDVAIERARQAPGAARRAATSVYAELRRRHPALSPHRLRKTTLRGLSWAIEDEVRASMTSGYLFGAFQEQRFYTPARPRWLELAGFAQDAFVFAEFAETGVENNLTSVPIAGDAPLRSEWAVVCDSPDFAVALSAWELPRQDAVPDRERTFESVWTIDPVAVRDASRVCAQVAEKAGAPGAAEVGRTLQADPDRRPVDQGAIALYNRVVAYVDRETDRG